jgi:NodT family efflux transporter outer membrane factor (OMF) lipoprotein
VNNRSLWFVAALSPLLSGCVVGPNYSAPDLRAPSAFHHAASQDDASAGMAPLAQADLANWWTSFDDPLLNELIDEALAANVDLRVARARLRESRALRGVVEVDYLPEVDAVGESDHNRESLTTNAAQAAGDGFDRTNDFYSVGFDATWELDVFGRVTRSVEAAQAEIESGEESLRDVRVSLLAEVATNYIALREFQQRLDLTRRNLDAQSRTLDLTQRRFDVGLAPEFDLVRAKAQVADTESGIPTLREGAALRLNRLATLLAANVADLAPRFEATGVVPAAATPGSGLPADLVRRRPDLRRAERNLAAETARVGVAEADKYPRFTLDGDLGWSAGDLGDFDISDSLFLGVAPKVTWAIVNLRRVRARVEAADARVEAALADYERSLLRAVEEVENALASLGHETARRGSLERSVASNARSLELARIRYEQGQTSFLDVLDSERALLEAENRLASSQARVSTLVVSLYKALGGGWELDARPAPEELAPADVDAEPSTDDAPAGDDVETVEAAETAGA